MNRRTLIGLFAILLILAGCGQGNKASNVTAPGGTPEGAYAECIAAIRLQLPADQGLEFAPYAPERVTIIEHAYKVASYAHVLGQKRYAWDCIIGWDRGSYFVISAIPYSN